MTNEMVKQIIEEELKINNVNVIKRFSGGMSNFTYLIKIDDELFTYRIPGKNSEVFVDRHDEYVNLTVIHLLDFNSPIVYFNEVNGHKMSKYVDGKNLSELNDLDYLEMVASKLKELHSYEDLAVSDYDKIGRLAKYEKLVDDLGFNRNPLYKDLKSEFLKLSECYNNLEMVFCHGDSQQSNWVISNDKIYLLDWEFAGNNDPFYDVACFGNNDFNSAIKLLDVYLGRSATDEELARLYFNRFFQTLQWYNVAVYKDLIGLSKDLNVDFLQVSEKYIRLASEFLSCINKLLK